MTPSKYQPALDGIRMLALSLVVAFHAGVPGTTGGYVGVDVFFVLSGYLITTLLLNEIDDSGSIWLRRFYVRRLLRLTPALLLMLGAYLLLAPLLWPERRFLSDVGDVATALSYTADYANAFWSVPARLRHTWSLSVEEHFYLVWPLLLLWLVKRYDRRRLIGVLAILYVTFSLWRVLWEFDGAIGYSQAYYRFDTRLSGLTLGALVAVLLRQAPKFELKGGDLLASLALLAIAACTFRFGIASTSAMTFGISIVEFATVVLILVGVSSGRTVTGAVLSHPVSTFIGRMSYGVYLWHYPIFFWLWGRWPWYQIAIVGGAASLVLAVASYYTVERLVRHRAQVMFPRVPITPITYNVY